MPVAKLNGLLQTGWKQSQERRGEHHCASYNGGEREKERETGRERDKERQRETKRDKERQRETERETERERYEEGFRRDFLFSILH